MESVRDLAVSTLRTLIDLHQREERRLRGIIAYSDSPIRRAEAQIDLEKVCRQIKSQTSELIRLEAENAADPTPE